jgi:hypothetical protein
MGQEGTKVFHLARHKKRMQPLMLCCCKEIYTGSNSKAEPPFVGRFAATSLLVTADSLYAFQVITAPLDGNTRRYRKCAVQYELFQYGYIYTCNGHQQMTRLTAILVIDPLATCKVFASCAQLPSKP